MDVIGRIIFGKMLQLFNNDFLAYSGSLPINLVVTSPPYNVGIHYDSHNDSMTYDQYLQWSFNWLSHLKQFMAEDGRLCINVPISATVDNINYSVSADITNIAKDAGYYFYRCIVWYKISSKTCWGSWRSASSPFVRDSSEAILVFSNSPKWKRNNKGESTITGEEFMLYTQNVWKMNAENNSDHPAAFPEELPSRCIKLFSYKGDTVMDCFMGSGTTGVMSKRLGRNFIGIEKSNKYFEDATIRINA